MGAIADISSKAYGRSELLVTLFVPRQEPLVPQRSRQSSVPSFLLHSGVDVAFTQETQMPVISAGDAGASSCHPDSTVPFSPTGS